MRSLKTYLLILGLTVASTLAGADGLSTDAIEVRPDNPGRYTVVRGDTLWDISARFLKKPWYWRQVWEANPQIKNPHRIYPGDVITLSYVDGRPVLGVERGSGTVRLSPKVRAEAIVEEVPTIPVDAIQPFLVKPLVVTRDELDAAPYVLAVEGEHVVGGHTRQRLFVRGIADDRITDWNVVRESGEFQDGATGEPLGLRVTYVGQVQLRRLGDPATVETLDSSDAIRTGDRLVPTATDQMITSFYPRSPNVPIQGRIISALGDRSRLARLDAVVIDRGAVDGLAQGDVLAITREGRVVTDPVNSSFTTTEPPTVHHPLDAFISRSHGISVQLPDEHNGLLMVFRTYPKLSFALILESLDSIQVGDPVGNP